MKIRNLIKRIVFYVSVPKCVNCREILSDNDSAICPACYKVYYEHKKRDCPRCAKKLSQCSCSSEYLMKNGVKTLVKLFRYSKQEQASVSNSLIYSLKQDNREDVLDFLATELTEAILHSFDMDKEKYIITNVPRRKSAICEYGFDHAAMLSKRVAEKLGVEYVDILISKSKHAQKSEIGQGRISNAKFAYKHKSVVDLHGKTVIIVDDIVTTGSSISNCALLIKKLGARKIIGAVLGIAYKDTYVKLNDWYSA